MELSNPDILSLTAILVSVASVYYSKGLRDLTQSVLHTNYRGLLAERHEKYRSALKEVEDKHRAELENLSSLASKAIGEVINVFDDFDIAKPEPRHLRHLLHECSEMVHYAFQGQLGWQSGRNIARRMFRFINCEDDLDPRSRHYSQDSSQASFAQEYFDNPNAYQEERLLRDVYFCALVCEMKRRLAPSDGPAILTAVLSQCRDFRTALKAVQANVGDSQRRLHQMIEEGEREHFKLRESRELYDRISYTQATLENLSCLLIPNVAANDIHKYRNFVSVTIYICVMLHAVQEFHSWGWHGYRARGGRPLLTWLPFGANSR